MGGVPGLVVAPPTLMHFGLVLGSLFWTDLRSKDGSVNLPLVSIKLLPAMKFLATALNVAEELLVSLHVVLEAGESVSGVVTSLMLTALDLVLETFTLSHVGCSVINYKMVFTLWTLELLVTSLVVVEGPGPHHRHPTLLAGVLDMGWQLWTL